MQNAYTENLSDIMAESPSLALQTLQAWADYCLPERFSSGGIKLAFNRRSGFVFLVNEDYQCAMLNNGKLEEYFCSPCDGIEGFFEEFLADFDDLQPEDQEWFREIAENLGRSNDLKVNHQEA